MFKKPIRLEIWTLICISLGGWLIHLRIHPPAVNTFNWIPLFSGIFSVFIMPVMFNYRATVRWAYLLNAATVIIGIITMLYFSLTHWQYPVTIVNLFMYSTFPDCVIVLAKLFPAHRILQYFNQCDKQEAAS